MSEDHEYKNNRTKHFICAILGICAACILTGGILIQRAAVVSGNTRELQQGIAGEVFRFHILANSDSEEDQSVKLMVRDAVISYMKEKMAQTGEPETADSTKQWASTHLEELTGVADRVLDREGYRYRSSAEVTTCYFPEKRYGDVIFPQGDYEALRIELGAAGGHNWWCVLYPNLCFIDTTCAVVSDEGKEELKETLTSEEYEMITEEKNVKIRWFFFGD